MSNANDNSAKINDDIDKLPVRKRTCDIDRRFIMNFKSRAPLELHTKHMVSVSAIDNETLIFCAQLLSLQNNLEQLMIQINNNRKVQFEEVPINGSVCLAQLKDGLCYRSTVMGVHDTNSFKIYTVDYGTIEMISFSKIFHIEPEFVGDKVYAYRFALINLLQDPHYKEEVYYHFYNIVKDQILELEVLPSKGPPIVQYCNLYLDGKSIVDMINEIICAAHSISISTTQLTFAELNVCKGSKHNVLVSYIDSVSHFYIHLYEYKDQLDNVMENLNIYCDSAPLLNIDELHVNMPCAALFPEDRIWYRAIILSINNNLIKVKYVDYGNCEILEASCLKLINPELVSCLEAQALLCCITGLENINQNESTTTQLEMLCLEKILNMTVVHYDVNKNCFVVDLVDSNINPPLNISKRIVELSSPRQICSVNNKSVENKAGVNPVVSLPDSEVSFVKSNLKQNNFDTQGKNGFAQEKYFDTSNFRKNENLQENFEKIHISQISEVQEIRTNLCERRRFKENHVTNMQQVLVCWFINPHNFHCQLKQNEFKLTNLMYKIQLRYSNTKRCTRFCANAGDPVIAKYRQDNALYRGQILTVKGASYIIDYVDYGFRDIVSNNEVYAIDDEFLLDPKFAIKCKIDSIIPVRINKTNLAEVFSFFKKDIFDCVFSDQDINGFMSVEISHKGENVGLKLVESGFAILAKEDIHDVIEFGLLTGQAIRGTIIGVKNFHQFFVKFLGTHSQLECCLYNWSTDETSSKYSKLKKSFCQMTENNTFIIYINEVQGTKLFVTLYDSSGVKITYFSCNESLCTLSSLCEKPIFKQNMQAVISHRSKNVAYIQEESDLLNISELLDDLSEFYKNYENFEQLNIQEGYICAAKSELDTNWYRAIIVALKEDAVQVKYLDYGNEELLPLNNIRNLHTKYYEINRLCLEVFVNNDFCCVANDILTLHLNKEVCGWSIKTEQKSLKSGIEKVKNDSEIHKETEYKITESITSDSLCHDIVVSHVDSPSQFWIQDIERLDDLERMQNSLQNIAEKLPSLTSLQVGKICVARYSIDDQWYRSIILDADTDITTVRFIDYGNADVISNVDNLIKDINGDLETFQPFSKKCSLMVVPAEGDDWSENACNKFNLFTQSANKLQANVLVNTEKCCYIELVYENTNIAEQLIAEGHAILLQNVNEELSENLCPDSDVESQIKCGYISHFVNLEEFYVQLECDRAGLEFLEHALTDAENFPVCKNPVEGIVCIAQFADDMLWYRASITKVMDDGHFEVFFIDFGNTGVTKEIREMPSTIDNIGQLAKQCYISVPDEMSHLSKEAGNKLQELSADGLTVFEIEFMTLKSPYKTELKLNNENILQKILNNLF